MMAHRPDSFIFWDASKVWDIDLVVSEHTHEGQVRILFKVGQSTFWFKQNKNTHN